ncbi:MAG: DNA polymerase III subunit delta' [Rhodocyclaceae bacterium]|nr:DNA polymerase III subunit delta' [Rhodocyclaceae bacterium]
MSESRGASPPHPQPLSLKGRGELRESLRDFDGNEPLYPWQKEIWNRLLSDLDHLPHALLLHGPEGSGKSLFAETLAARLLCETAQGSAFACGECQACNWFALGNHPDFRLVQPESEDEPAEAEPGGDGSGEAGEEKADKKKRSTQIRIDQVRELADFMVVGTHRQGLRIVILRPAEAMNVHTANGLLKLLEEPIAGSLFLLVSGKLNQLLPTVKSRCRQLHFGKPTLEAARAWLRQEKLTGADELLALAGGMPLAAQKLAAGKLPERRKRFLAAVADPLRQDMVRLAGELEGWQKQVKGVEADLDMPVLVDWLQKWVLDLARVAAGAPPIFHPHEAQGLSALAQKSSLAALFACYNDLQRARAVARHPLNARLFLEDMLLRYGRVFAQGTA